MMYLECPNCSKDIDVTDKLPERACDDEEYECSCGCLIEFGWYAEVEVRNSTLPPVSVPKTSNETNEQKEVI